MDQDPLKINKIQIVFIGFFLAVFIISKIFLTSEKKEAFVMEILPIDPFASVLIDAKSAYVFDITTNTSLFSKNEELQLPLASVTKIMTAAVASEIVPKETIVHINKEAISKEGDTGLLSGERWKLADLLDLTLVVSSNDGAAAIAAALGNLYKIPNVETINNNEENDSEKSFVALMNEAALSLGMAQTFFLNESGLDVTESISGAYSSAKDMAILFDYILKTNSEILSATRYSEISLSSIDDILHKVKNTNESIGAIPALIASKTGFTDLAGGNLVVAFEAGPMRPIIVSVLGSGINTRFSDVENLVWASIEKIAK